jgi:hypothetical protein
VTSAGSAAITTPGITHDQMRRTQALCLVFRYGKTWTAGAP